MSYGEDARAGLTDVQEQRLRHFREHVADILKAEHDDFYLLRWLRARNFDLRKSEDMIRKSMKWRDCWKIDLILTGEDWKPSEALIKYFPGGMCGYDRDGCPIWICPIGRIDMKGLSLSARQNDIVMYNLYNMERIHEMFRVQSEKHGRRIDKVVFICDFEGFTMKHLMAPGMEAMLKIMALVEANYPECLKKAYIINAPKVWGLVFNAMKPFLSEDTKRKLVILGVDYRDKIKENIDPSHLPVHWGGNMIDDNGDTACREKVCMGGEIPHSMYLSEQTLVDPSRLSHVTVGARSKYDVEFQVVKPNSVLKWFFKTESNDMGFGVSYTDEKGKTNIVVPFYRKQCHVIPENGVYECVGTGTYTVHFDNQFSLVTPKRLHYLVEVVNPSEEYVNSSEKYSTSQPDGLMGSPRPSRPEKPVRVDEHQYRRPDGYAADGRIDNDPYSAGRDQYGGGYGAADQQPQGYGRNDPISYSGGRTDGNPARPDSNRQYGRTDNYGSSNPSNPGRQQDSYGRSESPGQYGRQGSQGQYGRTESPAGRQGSQGGYGRQDSAGRNEYTRQDSAGRTADSYGRSDSQGGYGRQDSAGYNRMDNYSSGGRQDSIGRQDSYGSGGGRTTGYNPDSERYGLM